MTLIDTNILLDVVTNDPDWVDWSVGQLDAAAWAYRQAAKTGNLNATFAAGEVLFLQAQAGTGRERILKLAEGLGYLYSAATNRHAPACAELAKALQNGIGVATNLVCAYAWLSIAAQRNPAYRSELDQLVTRLDPSEVLQAQRIAHDYLAGHWPAPVARPDNVELGDSITIADVSVPSTHTPI